MIHHFDTEIACKVGVNAAVLYANIVFWCEKNRANEHNIHEGRAWTYNSVKAWGELFPYITQKQIRNALASLEEHGLIVSGEFNESAYDRTKWYSPNGELDLPHRATHIAPEGKPIPDNKPDITKRDTYVSLGKDEVQQAFDAYNEAAALAGWPHAQRLTQPRMASLKKRLKELGGLDGWKAALDKASASLFLTGRKAGRNGFFKANIDFLLQQSSLTKLMEGNYDNGPDSQQSTPRPQNRPDAALSNIARIIGL